MSITVELTYPHSEVNIKDESIGNPTTTLALPLHKPIFPIKAAKGPVNRIGWYTGDSALSTFGEETFDRNSIYYRNEQLFLQQGLFGNQGAFLVRLCDPAAKIASSVLECYVTLDFDAPQWERDANNGIITDEDGNPIPVLDPISGLQVTNKGVNVEHRYRTLEDGEDVNTVLPRTINVGGVDTFIYPLKCEAGTSPGITGNNGGSRFWFDPNFQDPEILRDNKCITYNFVPVEKPYGGDIPVVIKDIYGTNYTNFTVKPGQTQKSTGRQFSAKELLERLYTSTIGAAGSAESILPYQLHIYSENFKIIGDLILQYEPNLDGAMVDGWMVNILSNHDLSGRPYHNVVFSENTTPLSEVHTYYLDGGDDGDTSDTVFEELYRQLLSGELIQEVVDTARYPITHVYDVGYTLETKLNFAEFMVLQKRCKCIMSTQDTTRPYSTMDESLSTASVLMSRFRLAPESELYGTGALRAEIFGQSGLLTDRNIHQIVPATFWSMQKRATYQSGRNISNDIHGAPQSNVTIYRDVSFVPSTPEQKQLIYDNHLNYFEYKDMFVWFFADVGTIYAEKSSALSGSTYTDACVYTMYFADSVWSDYAGVTTTFGTLSTKVTRDIKNKCNSAYGNIFPDVTVTMSQTENDIQSGDTFHIEIVLMGYDKVRRFKTDLIARRESLTLLQA